MTTERLAKIARITWAALVVFTMAGGFACGISEVVNGFVYQDQSRVYGGFFFILAFIPIGVLIGLYIASWFVKEAKC